jgi:hypothetical protein
MTKKEKKPIYDLGYALTEMIKLPEPMVGQTWNDLESVEEHAKTISELCNRGADPTALKRNKNIMAKLPLE